MGCHDQRRANRLRRFSPLLIALIATVGLRPVVFTVRAPGEAETVAVSKRLT
jgi:hypothetical protein